MNRFVKINECDLAIKEWKNQRVISFQDIDVVHQRPDGTARHRFNSNKDRFIRGEDYFVVSKKDLETIENTELDVSRPIGIYSVSPRGTTYLTESGYLLLVKLFNDDLAWEVQRKLVNSYFKAKELVASGQFVPIEKFNELFVAFTEMKNQIAELKQETKGLESEIEKVDTKAMSALATAGAIESGHSIINGKMSDWVVAMSEKVRKLAAAADCSVSHMYSKLIENMEQKHHVKFKEFYGSYRHIFPQEEHPWRICVIDYFEDELLYCFEDVYRDEAEYYGLVAPRRKEDEWYPITVL